MQRIIPLAFVALVSACQQKASSSSAPPNDSPEVKSSTSIPDAGATAVPETSTTGDDTPLTDIDTRARPNPADVEEPAGKDGVGDGPADVEDAGGAPLPDLAEPPVDAGPLTGIDVASGPCEIEGARACVSPGAQDTATAFYTECQQGVGGLTWTLRECLPPEPSIESWAGPVTNVCQDGNGSAACCLHYAKVSPWQSHALCTLPTGARRCNSAGSAVECSATPPAEALQPDAFALSPKCQYFRTVLTCAASAEGPFGCTNTSETTAECQLP